MVEGIGVTSVPVGGMALPRSKYRTGSGRCKFGPDPEPRGLAPRHEPAAPARAPVPPLLALRARGVLVLPALGRHSHSPSSSYSSGSARLGTTASAVWIAPRGTRSCGTTTQRAPAACAARRPLG